MATIHLYHYPMNYARQTPLLYGLFYSTTGHPQPSFGYVVVKDEYTRKAILPCGTILWKEVPDNGSSTSIYIYDTDMDMLYLQYPSFFYVSVVNFGCYKIWDTGVRHRNDGPASLYYNRGQLSREITMQFYINGNFCSEYFEKDGVVFRQK